MRITLLTAVSASFTMVLLVSAPATAEGPALRPDGNAAESVDTAKLVKEMEAFVAEMRKTIRSGEVRWGDINTATRTLESACAKRGTPAKPGDMDAWGGWLWLDVYGLCGGDNIFGSAQGIMDNSIAFVKEGASVSAEDAVALRGEMQEWRRRAKRFLELMDAVTNNWASEAAAKDAETANAYKAQYAGLLEEIKQVVPSPIKPLRGPWVRQGTATAVATKDGP